jgi:ABC-2 type transport system permease protein
MSLDLTAKTLAEHSRGLAGWMLGFAGVAALYTSSYAILDPETIQGALTGIPAEIIEAMGWANMGTPTGYLGSTVFGIVGPILMVVFAIGMGSRLIAGDEESGTLEVIVSHPVTRTRLLVERSIALVLVCLAAAAVVLATVLLVGSLVGLDAPVGPVVAASANLGLLGVAIGALAILVGGLTGRRALVMAVGAVVAVVGYAGSTFLVMAEGLEWLRWISLFHYYDGPGVLESGPNLAYSAVLVAVAVAAVALGSVGFARRDLGT